MATRRSVDGLMGALQNTAALSAAHSDVVAARLGLAAADLKCLGLVQRKPCTPGELARELRLTPSTVTSILDRLEKDGYVARERGGADRRQVTVRVIPERVAEVSAEFTGLYRKVGRVLRSYDDAERALLLDYATRVGAILGAEIDAARGAS